MIHDLRKHNSHANFAAVVRSANEGDEIVVRSDSARELGLLVLARVCPEKTLDFVVQELDEEEPEPPAPREISAEVLEVDGEWHVEITLENGDSFVPIAVEEDFRGIAEFIADEIRVHPKKFRHLMAQHRDAHPSVDFREGPEEQITEGEYLASREALQPDVVAYEHREGHTWRGQSR